MIKWLFNVKYNRICQIRRVFLKFAVKQGNSLRKRLYRKIKMSFVFLQYKTMLNLHKAKNILKIFL